MNARGMVGVALGALVLAGCGGGGTAADPEASESASEPAPSSSAAEEPTATVAQYASIIARQDDLPKQLRDMDGCDWFGSGDLDRPGLITCGVGTLTLRFQAMTLRIELRNAQDSTRPKTYIGAPPAELEALVQETSDGAQLLIQALRSMPSRCVRTDAGECSTKRVEAGSAVSLMKSTLAGWRPYL